MGCAVPGYPTVYARVSEFMPWIKHIILGYPMPTTTPPPTTASPTNETTYENVTGKINDMFWNWENVSVFLNYTDNFGNSTEIPTTTGIKNNSDIRNATTEE